MLEIINNLSLFFEDNYSEFGVREYSRLKKISPPTASNNLKKYQAESLLVSRNFKNHILFKASRSNLFNDLAKIYWKNKLNKIGLVNHILSKFPDAKILVFGSISKSEITLKSDLDLAIISSFNQNLELKKYEQLLSREIQVFLFDSIGNISKNLKQNILSGFELNNYGSSHME